MINTLLKFGQKYPRTTAFIWGIVFCLIIILLVEFILRTLHASQSYEASFTYPATYHTRDQFGIRKAAPGQHHVILKNKISNEVIYDVTYSINPNGSRVTPIKNISSRDKFVLFLGCSFTYGEGVEDNQTLPYYLGSYTKEYQPYNFGFHGHGPFDILAQLENIDFKHEIKEPNGIVIYSFIDDHVERMLGSIKVMQWKVADPYYQQTTLGKFKRKETFLTGRPLETIFYYVLSKSKLLQALKFNWPGVHQPQIKQAAESIRQMKDKFSLKYPHSSFYVLLYPGEFTQHLIPFLDQMNIKYLDYTKEPFDYLNKNDQHPSAMAYKKIATKITRDLNLK